MSAQISSQNTSLGLRVAWQDLAGRLSENISGQPEKPFLQRRVVREKNQATKLPRFSALHHDSQFFTNAPFVSFCRGIMVTQLKKKPIHDNYSSVVAVPQLYIIYVPLTSQLA